jgi:ATP-dependent RNA helicase DDX1
LDLQKGEVSFTKNGKNLGLAFRINDQMKNEAYYPAVVLKNAEMLFNFGETDFKYKIPDGYVAVSKAGPNNTKTNPFASETASKEVFGTKPNAPQAIIIEPSRELAEQTFQQLEKFKKYLKDPIRSYLLIGGQSSKEQINEIQKGVDIIVATPGRLEDLITQGFLLLTHCRFFVLDEADGLLKQGNAGLIDRMHKQIPKISSDGSRLQMIVCSATLHDFEVKKMAERLMHFPTWVDLKGEDAVPDTVHHCVVMVDPQKDDSWKNLRQNVQTDAVHARDNVRPGNNTPETLSEAVKMLKGEYCIRAIREHKMDRAIIFCRTKVDCDNLENYFKQVNAAELSCVCLHADRAPNERKGNLQQFKDKRVKFLICTDVAARGIDVTGLPFMINITLPDEKSNYVHRIGRVGRAERMGLAISLVSVVPEKVWYHGQWCSSRGKNCSNTSLVEQRGCCIWYNEPSVSFFIH